MEKKVIVVCEGKSDVAYLNALQRFIENDIALHCDDMTFAIWKVNVLPAVGSGNARSHHDFPLTRAEHAPLFQRVLPHYSKRRVPFSLSVERLANLRRHLADPDVRTMLQILQPGVAFGEHLLQLFDGIYPGLIP